MLREKNCLLKAEMSGKGRGEGRERRRKREVRSRGGEEKKTRESGTEANKNTKRKKRRRWPLLNTWNIDKKGSHTKAYLFKLVFQNKIRNLVLSVGGKKKVSDDSLITHKWAPKERPK